MVNLNPTRPILTLSVKNANHNKSRDFHNEQKSKNKYALSTDKR